MTTTEQVKSRRADKHERIRKLLDTINANQQREQIARFADELKAPRFEDHHIPMVDLLGECGD